MILFTTLIFYCHREGHKRSYDLAYTCASTPTSTLQLSLSLRFRLQLRFHLWLQRRFRLQIRLRFCVRLVTTPNFEANPTLTPTLPPSPTLNLTHIERDPNFKIKTGKLILTAGKVIEIRKRRKQKEHDEFYLSNISVWNTVFLIQTSISTPTSTSTSIRLWLWL